MCCSGMIYVILVIYKLSPTHTHIHTHNIKREGVCVALVWFMLYELYKSFPDIPYLSLCRVSRERWWLMKTKIYIYLWNPPEICKNPQVIAADATQYHDINLFYSELYNYLFIFVYALVRRERVKGVWARRREREREWEKEKEWAIDRKIYI